MSFRVLFLALLPFTLSLAAAQEAAVSEQSSERIWQPMVRTTILAEGYRKLCDAIETDDVIAVAALFKEFPGLVAFSHQPVGSPLHFVRSSPMARFLVERIGISASFCDEWGETAASAIAQSKPDRFSSKHEQRVIAQYLKMHESMFQKAKSQIMHNKNLHMKLSVAAMTGILVTQLAVLIEIFLIKYKALHGV